MRKFSDLKRFLLTILIFLLISSCHIYEAAWSAQCWKKHNSGSIRMPDGESKRPFGILCTFRCMLWYPPVYPSCEMIFDLRLSRHFTNFPDCYEIRCNETFSLFSRNRNY